MQEEKSQDKERERERVKGRRNEQTMGEREIKHSFCP